VEEKFLRCKTCEVAILDEALASGTEVVLAEMRQSSLTEAKRDTLTLDILLTDASHDLRDIEI
jgi:hypothetical protein